MFKKIPQLILSTILLLLFACSNEQQASGLNNFANNNATAIQQHSPKITSNLWKIEKKNEPISYLVGSLHFGKKEDQLPAKINRVIPEVAIIYTEISFPNKQEKPTDPDYIEFLTKMYDTTSGKTLADKIGIDNFNKVKQLFVELGQDKKIAVNADKIPFLEPWILSILLPQIIAEKNFSSETGIDYLIVQQGKNLNKSLGSLEKHMYRYHILKQKPIELIIHDIEPILNSPNFAKMQMSMLYYLYHSGYSYQLIGETINQSSQNSSLFGLDEKTQQSSQWLQNELLIKRNLDWMPKILTALPKQKNLFVVGLLHLYGPSGIIQQLRNNGYTVIPIN